MDGCSGEGCSLQLTWEPLVVVSEALGVSSFCCHAALTAGGSLYRPETTQRQAEDLEQ